MCLLFRVIVVISLVSYVRSDLDSDQQCESTDLNDSSCSKLETFFSSETVDRIVHALNLSSEIINYAFQPNSLNSTNYESMAKSINLIIFNPGGNEPRNISLNDVLNDCSALRLSGSSTKLMWSGWTNNCNGTAPSNIIFDFTNDQMQEYADATDATIIAVDWGFSGLSCYGYVELIFCVIGKLVDLSVHWMTKCGVDIGTLDLYGHSLGAQIVGYIAQRFTGVGQPPRTLLAFDPAGPGFGPPFRCQGVQDNTAGNVAVYHVNPDVFGTADLTIGDSVFLFNPQHGFIQPNCSPTDPFCSHNSIRGIFLALTQNVTITGTRASTASADANQLTTCVGSNVTLTVYEDMPDGVYCVDTYENLTEN